MTTTKVRDSVISLTLTASSVKKAVKSFKMSKRYINTMMKATIINILYHRLNIDKKEFVSKSFNNIPFKTFRPKSHNIYIREFHTYMLACKDALDKNYLREFYLYFIDVASGDIVENYKFSFQYAEHNESQHEQKEESLMESTCELLRTLEELGQHTKFDIEIQIKAEFTYFDDTPEEYEPPGFRGINEDDSLVRKINKKGNSVVIGTLFTGFHMLKCRGIGDVFNFNTSAAASAEIEMTEDAVNRTEGTRPDTVQAALNTSSVFTENCVQIVVEPDVNDANKSRTSIAGDRTKTQMNDTYMSQFIELSSDDETEVDCPCKLPNMEFCTVDLIQCRGCERRYHTPCQGYLDNSFISQQFRCFNCKGDDDSIVATFDARQSVSVYRIRFILAVIYKYGKIPIEFKTMFEDTVKNFEKLKIFEIRGNDVKFNIQILNDLFKFDYKMPDVDKFNSISNA